MQAISALGGSNWGLTLKDLRHIYTACVAPIALYAASVWYAPPIHGFKLRHHRQVKVLERLQRRAGKTISGGFKLVSGDAYNAELHLLPQVLTLRQRRAQTLLRIATTPAYRRHMLDRRRHHRKPTLQSPLHAAEEEVQLSTGLDPQDLEMRLPWAVPPWWQPPAVDISESKALSITHHHIHAIAYPDAIRLYTDGSGINGQVGASAVCLDPPLSKQAYLGVETEYNVPIAEIAGLVLALRLLKQDLVPADANTATADSRKRVEIYSDNQGALRALQNPRQSSGQYLVLRVIKLFDILHPVVDIYFYWLAAHAGVPGNELADQLAKEATGWRRHLPPGVPGPMAPTMQPDFPTRAPLDTWIKRKMKDKWKESWTNSSHGEHLRQLLPDINTKSVNLYDNLEPAERSVLAQMRTGKIGLNDFLASINRADSARCPCGNPRETVHLVLIGCTLYDDLRRTTWADNDDDPRDLVDALSEKNARRSAQFILKTGRLTYLMGATQPRVACTGGPSTAE